MSLLLDTNVISEVRRRRDPHVRAWADSVDDADLRLSVLSLGELRSGIDRLRRHDAAQAEVFARWLSALRTRFAGRILAVDTRVADRWGQINAAADHNTVDSLIAATAHVHELTVVTRNTKDFQGCGVPLLNPWAYEPQD